MTSFLKVKRLAVVLTIILFIGTGSTFAQPKNDDFKVVKNLDLFFSVFRELKLFYVDDIDPDKVVKSGIDGMLSELDPYTEYMTEEEAKDFVEATTGEYGGIGSLIRKSGDYTEISEVYEGFPADKAGLVSGDLILEIDGVSMKDKPIEDVSSKLKGTKGSSFKLKIAKVKTKDTVNIKITREKIHISSITYSNLFANGVGYIRLASFTQGCSKDFRKVFLDLKKAGNMNSLIIDLRGNGGGPTEDAINIVGMFAPKGTEVMSSKGRIAEFDMVFKTEEEPIDTIIPVAVLVNSGSASSSEIVAGAFQDLDRGIVVGTRTFGKGLVQAVRPLNYNAKVKITTAKYYTPSGRCVQAHNFSKRNEDGSVSFIPDSLKTKFYTKSGRVVYDGGGILPDIQDSIESYSNITVSLLLRGLISDYSVKYYCKHESVAAPEVFELSDADYAEFVAFLEGKEYDYQTRSESLLKQLKTAVAREKYDEVVEKEITVLEEKLAHDKKKDLEVFKLEIKRLIEEEIAVRYYYQKGRIRVLLKEDSQFDKAVEYLLSPNKYQQMLSPDVKTVVE
ncbi:MAG: S41 family peptidase [Prevotellaceae bacterium]|jgi:carboxyl-terminal processing protease|nr:S41 family peptidase [Prevotellaceae bacterium]